MNTEEKSHFQEFLFLFKRRSSSDLFGDLAAFCVYVSLGFLYPTLKIVIFKNHNCSNSKVFFIGFIRVYTLYKLFHLFLIP